jgi:hypothetical protein
MFGYRARRKSLAGPTSVARPSWARAAAWKGEAPIEALPRDADEDREHGVEPTGEEVGERDAGNVARLHPRIEAQGFVGVARAELGFAGERQDVGRDDQDVDVGRVLPYGRRHLRLSLGKPAGQGAGKGEGCLRFRVPRVELGRPSRVGLHSLERRGEIA